MKTFKRVSLFTALRDDAKRWYQNDLDDDSRAEWDKLKAEFLEWGKKKCASIVAEGAIINEIAQLRRRTGEPLADYIKRADKLRAHCPRGLQQALARNFFTNMTDGEVDSTLKVRVQDRLTAENLIDQYMQLVDGCQYEDIRRTVLSCSSDFGKTNELFEALGVDDEDDDGFDKQCKLMSRAMAEVFKAHQAPNNVYNPGSFSRESPKERERPVTTPGPGYTCWNCGGKGHAMRSCPQPRKTDAEIAQIKAADLTAKAANASRQANAMIAANPGLNPSQMSSNLVMGLAAYDHVAIATKHDKSLTTRAKKTLDLGLDCDVQKRAQDEIGSAGPTGPQTKRPKIVLKKQDKQHDDPTGDEDTTPAVRAPAPAERAGIPPAPSGAGKPWSPKIPVDPDGMGGSPQAETRNAPEDVEEHGEADSALFKEFLKWKREQDKVKVGVKEPTRRRQPPQPIKAIVEAGDQRFSLAKQLKKFDVDIDLAQLLDCSPRMRTEFMRLLQKKDKDRLDREHIQAAAAFAFSKVTLNGGEHRGDAISVLELSTPHLGFVQGFVCGAHTERLLVDGGSNMELINPEFAYQNGMSVRALPRPMSCRVADDHFSLIDKYVLIHVLVGGIRSLVAAWLCGQGASYDVLLGKTWLNCHRAVENHGEKTLLIHATNGYKAEVELRQLYHSENPVKALCPDEYRTALRNMPPLPDGFPLPEEVGVLTSEEDDYDDEEFENMLRTLKLDQEGDEQLNSKK